jgi:hypothetical protein
MDEYHQEIYMRPAEGSADGSSHFPKNRLHQAGFDFFSGFAFMTHSPITSLLSFIVRKTIGHK